MDSPKPENREERGIGTSVLEIIALSPLRGRTPWWSRRLTYSHIVMAVDGYLWDQPMSATGKGYYRDEWLAAAGPRECLHIHIYLSDILHPAAWKLVCSHFTGTRKGQKWRSILRYLHLWPWPVFNCTTPVRNVLRELGYDIKGETPDAIVRELRQYCPYPTSD